jgi:hypothetical protein
MKTVLIAAIIIAISWFWLANTTITFHPFSIKFERPYYAFLWIVLLVTITQLMRVEYIRGRNNCLNDIKKIVDEAKNEKQNRLFHHAC